MATDPTRHQGEHGQPPDPAKPAGGGKGRRAVRSPADLAQMELRGTEDVAAYCQAARELLRATALELHATAAELQQKLSVHGGNQRTQVAHRIVVRRTLRKLRVAAGRADRAADDIMRFWKDYLRNFAELIEPHKARRGWQWEPGKPGKPSAG